MQPTMLVTLRQRSWVQSHKSPHLSIDSDMFDLYQQRAYHRTSAESEPETAFNGSTVIQASDLICEDKRGGSTLPVFAFECSRSLSQHCTSRWLAAVVLNILVCSVKEMSASASRLRLTLGG